jgi:hypothetical protein
VWEKTQFCSKQHARVIAQIYYVRLFVFNRRMCSIATPKNVGEKNDGQCRFKRAEIRQYNHHDCRIISRNLNEEKISNDGNPDIKAGRKSRFMLEVSEKA